MQRQVEVLRTEGEPEATAAEHKRTRNESELAERGCAKILWAEVCVSAK